MAYWDSKKIGFFDSMPIEGYNGWQWIDCGCCMGLVWGAETPIECNRCKGTGFLAYHKKSDRLALYPGGPFAGSMSSPIREKDDNALV